MAQAYLSTIESAVLAAVLGGCLAFSVRRQWRLFQAAQHHESKSPLFERISYAGLSLAILFGAIVVGQTVSALDRYEFIGVFFLAAVVGWFIAARSNHTIERDARKNTARPSS